MIKNIFVLILFVCPFLSFSQNLKKLDTTINKVNTVEFCPVISSDGKSLIFEANWSGASKWKLYESKKLGENKWSVPRPLNEINNSSKESDFIGGPFLTYDNNYLYFTSDRKGGIGKTDVWFSKRNGDSWDPPQNVGSPINSANYDGFPSITSDGKTMYFMRGTGTQKESVICYDIYRSTKNIDGTWGEPKKLPPVINSGCEGFPKIMADNKTLIFSSFRDGGKGGFDFYKSVLDDNGNWSTPENLDFLNTDKNEKNLSVPASGEIVYLSAGDGIYTDIYFTDIPKNFRPKRTILVTGIIKDKVSNKPLFANLTIKDVETNQIEAVIQNNKSDGKYSVVLTQGKNYDFSVSQKGYLFFSDRFDLNKISSFKEYENNIELSPVKKDAMMILNNIYFEYNSSDLLKASMIELDRVVQVLKDYPDIQVEISAHTDDKGTVDYNLTLSQLRANSVVKYLSEHGIDKSRLIPKGYGKSHPRVPNNTENNQALNRRVEFRII